MKRLIVLTLMMAVVAVLTMAMAQPAGAGAAQSFKLIDFYTSALQGNWTPDSVGAEGFNWVFCSQATRVQKPDGSAREVYQCELTEWIAPPDTPPGMGPDLGPLVYPDKAMRFKDETGTFYFSDFIFLTSFPDICVADTWREELSPSGQVTMIAEYGPVDCAGVPDNPCCYTPEP